MAKFCLFSGCGRPHHAKGWCTGHYKRWLAGGDPSGVRARRGELPRFFDEVVLPYEGNDCLLWPYAQDGQGYGVMRRDGKRQMVHRLVCEYVNGEPAPGHEATHTCGHGHLGCVSKRHLVWKTHSENMADKYLHGTVSRGELNGHAKLTSDDVREIRSLKDTQSQREIAQMFDIDKSTVSRIYSGIRWGSV